MPLVIMLIDGRRRPVIVCDHCGEVIVSADMGQCRWLAEEEAPAAYFTHCACGPAFEESCPGPWACADLEGLPAYLGNSLGVDWKLLQWKAEALRRS